MAFVDEATATAYREAWEAWKKQMEHLHRVFLDGETHRPGPDQGPPQPRGPRQGKVRRRAARPLGLEESPLEEPSGDGNPFPIEPIPPDA